MQQKQNFRSLNTVIRPSSSVIVQAQVSAREQENQLLKSSLTSWYRPTCIQQTTLHPCMFRRSETVVQSSANDDIFLQTIPKGRKIRQEKSRSRQTMTKSRHIWHCQQQLFKTLLLQITEICSRFQTPAQYVIFYTDVDAMSCCFVIISGGIYRNRKCARVVLTAILVSSIAISKLSWQNARECQLFS